MKSPPLSLEDQVIAALRRITRAIDLHSRGLLQQIGLTAPQLAALQAIERLQPVSIGRLAKAIHLSQATLTGILTRLENRSLVTRTRSGEDRRSVVIELTDTARNVLTTAPSLLHDRFRRELLDLQEWERSQMLATLQRIASMMHVEEIEAAPMLASVAAAVGAVDVPPYVGDALSAAEPASAADPRADDSTDGILSGRQYGIAKKSAPDELETIP